MRKEGVWWVRRMTHSRWLAGTAGLFAVLVFSPIVRAWHKDGGLVGAVRTTYGGPFHDWTLLVVLVVGLVLLALMDMSSRWITRRIGREPTSLNGWVTLTTFAGTLTTVEASILLFPLQWTAELILTCLCAMGFWHLVGQALFGAKDGGERFSS